MIVAFFYDGDTYTRTYGLTQWNYGQKLCVCGIKCEKVSEVHFACEGDKEALIQLAEKDGEKIIADIPDILVETGKNIIAYLYVADESSGETVRTVYIQVERRQKPKDYDSPADKNLLRQILEKLDTKADNAKIIDDALQLMSGNKEIGDRIRLPTGGGREIELRNNGEALQWRYTDSNEWQDLILVNNLKGKDGETPEFELRDGHLFAIYQEER